ncbi:hypothetical protein [Streptomyces sp. SM11]|uniref:hypothetical protein n=1 Tax=Streptomyces sp. SM11 TaxID=565557 RepID=UPI000CD4D767|nr:hypothetical protein [Streptomyces sp. SM11]
MHLPRPSWRRSAGWMATTFTASALLTATPPASTSADTVPRPSPRRSALRLARAEVARAERTGEQLAEVEARTAVGTSLSKLARALEGAREPARAESPAGACRTRRERAGRCGRGVAARGAGTVRAGLVSRRPGNTAEPGPAPMAPIPAGR